LKKGELRLVRWGVILWLAGLGLFGIVRALALASAGALLAELGSRMAPAALRVVVALSVLSGIGLLVSAWGVFRRREWGRQAARVSVVVYFVVVQGYVWLFVRTGLLWARRWVLLALAAVGILAGVGGLTWHRSRRWLGLISLE